MVWISRRFHPERNRTVVIDRIKLKRVIPEAHFSSIACSCNSLEPGAVNSVVSAPAYGQRSFQTSASDPVCLELGKPCAIIKKVYQVVVRSTYVIIKVDRFIHHLCGCRKNAREHDHWVKIFFHCRLELVC